MKKGFSTIMAAQFFSSLADNALFVAAVELLRNGGSPEWHRAGLVPLFALFYVVLAPFVGAFADAVPKGRVMFRPEDHQLLQSMYGYRLNYDSPHPWVQPVLTRDFGIDDMKVPVNNKR
mgnify:CR=1 FL=1